MTDIPFVKPIQFGTIIFEGEQIVCAFAGEPGNFMAYVDIEAVFQISTLQVDAEIQRIQNHHLLTDGLFQTTFTYYDNHKKISTDRLVIALSRLHTWLALILLEIIPDDLMRQKLIATQKELTDVIYGYFGRVLMPREILEEEAPYLSPEKKDFYDKLDQAAQASDRRINVVENRVGQLEAQVRSISMQVKIDNDTSYINPDRQERLRAIIAILNRLYNDKHGPGNYNKVEGELKMRFGFKYYREIPNARYPDVIRECSQIFRGLVSKGTPMYKTIQNALVEINQDSLFK
jgi:hypothetical protein